MYIMALDNSFPASVWIPILLALGLAGVLLLMARQRRKRKAFSRAARHTHHITAPVMFADMRRPDSLHGNEQYARWQMLTLRERQVAALAAAGKQNVEIAHELHVSPTTISSHLKNIYRKLGIHSRRELANLLQDIASAGDG